MENDALESQLREYFETLTLPTLRVLGRRFGVDVNAFTSKPKLVEATVDLMMCRTQPVIRSNRGAPVKQDYLDPEVLNAIARIRMENTKPIKRDVVFEVNSPTPPSTPACFYEIPTYQGILEVMPEGYGFVRANVCQPNSERDVYIPSTQIRSFKLRTGDYIVCNAQQRQKNDCAALDMLLSVNEKMVGQYEQRSHFDSLTACYPDEKLTLARKQDEIDLRMLDLFCPIGKGQRGLIISPPKAGKTTLLKHVAKSLEANRDISLIVLLIDERPEEVTDFKNSLKSSKLIYSTFDEDAARHVHMAEIAIEHAKRLAESGRDAVILLDSLTKLTRAYNYVIESSGKTLSGGLDASVFAQPKRFFGAARNLAEGGSLTILATALVETGSRMDEVIYEEFKGTGNADIFLSRDMAQRRVFPAIELRRSGTRREDLLLSEAELKSVTRLRERGLTDRAEAILDMMKKTENNEQFVSRTDDWLKIYKEK